MFVTNKTILEIAENLQSEFEHGDLHSQSSINEIAKLAQNELLERQLPTRKSLAFVVAKNALNLWHETVFQTKKRNF
tara:strand:+ start:566 stop:796 length:231 start_codon:yes stop_codon:yes gene_type:complete